MKLPQTYRQLVSKIRKLRFNKASIVIGSIVLLIILAVILYAVSHQPNKTTKTIQIANQLSSSSTLSPDGKTMNQLGGLRQVSPEGVEPVYAFNDSLDDVSINVSQQTLPESFKKDAGAKVADLAKNYSATNVIKAGDVTVHIGNSSKGPQSVIFTKKDVLVLIKSENTISDTSWAAYIESLN